MSVLTSDIGKPHTGIDRAMTAQIFETQCLCRNCKKTILRCNFFRSLSFIQYVGYSVAVVFIQIKNDTRVQCACEVMQYLCKIIRIPSTFFQRINNAICFIKCSFLYCFLHILHSNGQSMSNLNAYIGKQPTVTFRPVYNVYIPQLQFSNRNLYLITECLYEYTSAFNYFLTALRVNV